MRMSRARSRSPHRASPAPLNHRQRATAPDRKSTRLNSSHGYISHAVFCLKQETRAAQDRPEVFVEIAFAEFEAAVPGSDTDVGHARLKSSDALVHSAVACVVHRRNVEFAQ